jgi:hypothetical protein
MAGIQYRENLRERAHSDDYFLHERFRTLKIDLLEQSFLVQLQMVFPNGVIRHDHQEFVLEGLGLAIAGQRLPDQLFPVSQRVGGKGGVMGEITLHQFSNSNFMI